MAAPTKPVIAVFVGNEGPEAAGTKVVEKLHSSAGASIHIRVVVRKPAHARPEWADWGCEVLTHDIRRPGAEKIFKDDCNAAFWATPTSEDREALTEKFLQGCIENGIDFPVVISATAAGSPASVHLKAYGQVEAACKKLAGKKVKEQFWDKGKQVLQPIILRVAVFYESLYAFLPTLKQGFLYLPLPSDGRAPWVSLDDVGAAAAEILVRPDQWGDKTLELTAGTQSGGDLARSLTMHSREGGVKFEPIDRAIAEAAYVAGGLPKWIAKANAEQMAFYGGSGLEPSSDLSAVLGRKPTPFATFAKAMKPHIQSDTPLETPMFVKSLATGSKKKQAPAAAAAAPAADGADQSSGNASAVAAAVAKAGRDSTLMVTLTATVADPKDLKKVLEEWIREAETNSRVQMLEAFASPGSGTLQILGRHGGAEMYAEHITTVGPAMGSLVKILEDLPPMRVCGAVTPHLTNVINQVPGRAGFHRFKKIAGVVNYKFSSSGVPQGRRHGVMISAVAEVREDKLEELKELIVTRLVPSVNEPGVTPPQAYEWYLSDDGTQVSWFEKHAKSEDACTVARKTAPLLQAMAEELVIMPPEVPVSGSASPNLLAAIASLRPVVYDKVAGFTRYEL